jgi:predicted transcriptional regulator
MSDYKLTQTESKFADIIWDNQPLSSPELVRLSERDMNWKKSTTYTVLKKLCDKGIFKNENAQVSAVMTKDEFYSECSRRYVEDAFGGSLPKFLAAFMSGGRLSQKRAEELKRLIDAYRED